jgi:hypothetical protein
MLRRQWLAGKVLRVEVSRSRSRRTPRNPSGGHHTVNGTESMRNSGVLGAEDAPLADGRTVENQLQPLQEGAGGLAIHRDKGVKWRCRFASETTG